MDTNIQARPIANRLITPGVGILLGLTSAGLAVTAWRFMFGLGSVTHLDNDYPWGLWKAFNVVTGIAIAAGGFTTAAFVEVFHRHQFRSIARPALLSAALGYTFAVLALVIDIGRYYSIWHPILPSMWQGDSVLFEVAMCVMCYLTILYVELFPVVSERVLRERRYPGIARLFELLEPRVRYALYALIPLGVVISCLHQSSLGNLMLIAPTKMHPLWYTPVLSLMFLLSAIAVGFPVVIAGSLYSAWALKLPYDMACLSRLARYVPPLIGTYLAFKLGDMVIRESYRNVSDIWPQGILFGLELLLLAIPIGMLLTVRVRLSPRWLFVSTLMIVAGVVLNRLNVFLVAYRPPHVDHVYFPSAGEFAVGIGLIAAMILCFRLGVSYLPIIATPWERRRP